MAKERLDILLVERGLAGSRERAKRMIMAGEVLVDGQKIDKAGTTVTAGLRPYGCCTTATPPVPAAGTITRRTTGRSPVRPAIVCGDTECPCRTRALQYADRAPLYTQILLPTAAAHTGNLHYSHLVLC